MKKFFFLVKEIRKGKSVIRAYLNFHLLQISLKGKTIDIGGGKGEGYISFLQRAPGVSFETFDLKVGKNVDFERDLLPSGNDVYDTVLFLNVMEHIFNYQHIADEVVRITKPGGQLIGYVPFMMWYHPDHRDFFRYTNEAIEKIFEKAGGKKINIIPNDCGPFMVGAHMKLLLFPRILRPLIFSTSYFLDFLYLASRRDKSVPSKYVLGYLFLVEK